MQRNENVIDLVPADTLIAEIFPKLTPEALIRHLSTNKRYYQLRPHYNSLWLETAKTKFEKLPSAPEAAQPQPAILFNQMKRDEAYSKTEQAGQGISATTILCAIGVLAFIGGGAGLLSLSNPDTNHEIGFPACMATLALSLLFCISGCVYRCYQNGQVSKREENIKILQDVAVAGSEEPLLTEDVKALIKHVNTL